MKNITLLFVSILWLSMGVAFAENKWLCHSVTQYGQFNNGSSAETYPVKVIEYQYDNNSMLISKKISVDNSFPNIIPCQSADTLEYYYDNNGNVIKTIQWYNNCYQNRKKEEFAYDGNNNAIWFSEYSWSMDDDGWILGHEVKYSYPTDNPKLSQWFFSQTQLWDSYANDWSNKIEKDTIENTFDNFGNLIYSVYSVWNEAVNDFVGQRKYSFSYDSNGNVAGVSIYDYKISYWSSYPDNEFTYSYDNDGNILSESLRWGYRKEYTYDCNGNKVLYSFFYDDNNGNLTKDTYEEYVYDSNGNKTLVVTYKKQHNNITDKDVWDYNTKCEYTYDNNGNLISEIAYYWYWDSFPYWVVTSVSYGTCSSSIDVDSIFVNCLGFVDYQSNDDNSYKRLVYSNEERTNLIAAYEYDTNGKWINTIILSYLNYCPEVSVEPTDKNVFISWHPNELAESYTLYVYTDLAHTNLVCMIKFDDNGQIIDIHRPAQSKMKTASTTEHSYTIENLSSNTTYYYVLETLGAFGVLLAEKSDEFTTTENGITTDVVEIDNYSSLPEIVGYYNILGKKLENEPANGIYIIMYDNGKAEKVMK